MKIKQAFLIILSVVYSMNISAAVYQTHASIEKKAMSFLGSQLNTKRHQKLDIQLRPLDKRLRLEQCSTPLTASLPYGTKNHTNTSIAIQCSSGNGWKIYVTAKIKRMGNIYKNQFVIKKGQQISASDLMLQEADLNTIRGGFFSHKNKLIGKVATRNIRANSIITPNMIKRPRLVRKGDRVTLLATKKGLEVRMQGEAIMDGASGEHIRVKSLSSKRIVEGTVISPGVIRVSFL